MRFPMGAHIDIKFAGMLRNADSEVAAAWSECPPSLCPPRLSARSASRESGSG